MNLYVPDFIWQRTDLGTMEKALYGILRRYAGKKDHCWPAQAKLASELGCSVPSVRSYLKALQELALIRIRKTGYCSSTYHIIAAKNFSEGCKNFEGGCKKSLHEMYSNKYKHNIPPYPQLPACLPLRINRRFAAGGGIFSLLIPLLNSFGRSTRNARQRNLLDRLGIVSGAKGCFRH